ncbi:MAG: GGDEF domain-containing protein [Spirochaetaceae bacterium]|nr:GGDEF domain-containing protein [Spirochaetaceae bacterium]
MDYIWIVEINSFCLLLLGILLYSLCKNYDRQTKQRYYMKAIISGMIAFFCEIIWALIEAKALPLPRAANFCTNGIYDISSILMGYYWLCYVEIALNSDSIKNKWLKTLAKMPVIMIAVCVVISYFNGFLFYVDENNVYHRGRFIVLHIVLCQLYTVITTIHAFIKSLKCGSYMKSVEYKILAMFLLFPLSIGLIQIAVPNIPSISVGVTLAFVFVYIDLQNLLISVDTLSGLNNRNQLLRYLSSRMKTDSDKSKLYLFMLDVNKFKKINDTYGHVEGDSALIRCANALKLANNNGKNFIGRYGGDEFIVIADLNGDEDAEKFCGKVADALGEICKKDQVPYDLSFSFGYVTYDKQMKTIQAFIAAADQKLYEAKKRRDEAAAKAAEAVRG